MLPQIVVAIVAGLILQISANNPALSLAVVAFLFFIFRLISGIIDRRKRRMEGQAYILLEVKPPSSPRVALALSKEPEVLYSAVVWGDWDIILRVQTTDAATLVQFVDKVQRSFEEVERTETYFIRPDQLLKNPNEPSGGKWAFLLLKAESKRMTDVVDMLKQLPQDAKNFAQMLHAAGTLGTYDIIVSVRYFNVSELKALVLDHIQTKECVKETQTVLAIEGHVYDEGKAVG